MSEPQQQQSATEQFNGARRQRLKKSWKNVPSKQSGARCALERKESLECLEEVRPVI